MKQDDSDLSAAITRVSNALGRTAPAAAAPVPPTIPEPLVRLVHSDFGLGGLFVRMARQNGVDAEGVYVGDLVARVVDFIKSAGCKAVAHAVSPLLDRLGIPQALKDAGLLVRPWDTIQPDEMYDIDCGLTDAWSAVAETGSIVIKPSANHGRMLSLVPPLHVAIIEPKIIVGDLVDLLEKLKTDNTASGTILITGPSKTADIEMTLVVGVHGPKTVKAIVIQ